MLYTVYILYSPSLDQYYIGYSQDVSDRIFRHNNSGSKATKKANDWKLVYTESFDSKTAAYKREMEIKRKKSKKYIEWLISSAGLERPEGFREGHPERFRDNLHW